MSYILDALKKSEQERARQMNQAMSLQDSTSISLAAETPFRSINRILLSVALVTVITGLLYGLTLLSGKSAPVPVENTPQVTALADDITPAAETVTLRQAPPVAAVTPAVGATPVPLQQTPVSTPSPAPETAIDSELRETAPRAGVETRSLPPLASLRRIPQLMITSHIYSPVPEKRTVSMNNREWNEGDLIAPGIILKEITPGGILLDVDGWPLQVGRSKGWQAIP
ncbi:general secretion pathway protein GspB [Thalassolituus sp. ST750PaO-4]|uniref:general secretion pathway protein GspB n=1 Tax=Thalassolituus sp. ST750PaO-4 TaxID=2742965 RepID=UPI001CE31758|nr:general secretion pathway protein GspB [Thalassolituus sp. ST750PaO-4]MCA6060889.1 general secretion pathway protein GspB [Thalassolituus sp. ST750PaO-4]